MFCESAPALLLHSSGKRCSGSSTGGHRFSNLNHTYGYYPHHHPLGQVGEKELNGLRHQVSMGSGLKLEEFIIWPVLLMGEGRCAGEEKVFG